MLNVKDSRFGAKGDGIADDTAAIQAALNAAGVVYLPQGTYKITSQLVASPTCAGVFGDGMYLSVLDKHFNGNAILVDTSGAVVREIGIAGNGATYTGGGIVPRGFNIDITRCRINDTQDSPILLVGSSTSSTQCATYLRVDSCFLLATNPATTYAVRAISADEPTRPTCRVFTNLSGGGPLVNFDGMNFVVLRDSLGTSVNFTSTSQKVVMQGNRITSSSASINILGVDHCIDGNMWGFGNGYSLTIDASASDVFFGPANVVTSGGSFMVSVNQNISTGAANPNNVSTQLQSYPFAWYGTTLNASINDGTYYAYYKQEGRMCHVTFGFVVGSSTSVGSGTWYWPLPFKAYVTAVGPAMVRSSSGTYYTGVAEVQGGSGSFTIYLHGGTGQLASTSLAFSAGALVEVSISYLVAPT